MVEFVCDPLPRNLVLATQFFAANLQILESYYQQDKYFLFFYSGDPEFG